MKPLPPLPFSLDARIYYARLEDGLRFFVQGLGFRVRENSGTVAVAVRDSAEITLVADAVLASTRRRPEITIETDSVFDDYNEILRHDPSLFSMDACTIERKPWGTSEFAVRDFTGVVVYFRQW